MRDKIDKAAKILKDNDCWFLFLPPYNKDLNPIEMVFSKLKAHHRRIGSRTFDQLKQAIGGVCDLLNQTSAEVSSDLLDTPHE